MTASPACPALADRADDDLMQMIRDGAADLALPVLERRYGREIRRVVQAILRDPSLAADAADEVIEKIWLKRQRYSHGTNFRAWLLGVARNHALTVLRGRRRAARVGTPMSFGGEEFGGDPIEQRAAVVDDGAEADELGDALNVAVADLPDRYRTVFEMCVREQRPYSEVSKELDLPKGTVAIRIRRARQRLFGALAHRLERSHVRVLANQYATCA
jgi:RNA polymerase sigma-70 factor (ECF subfamily)